MQITLPNLARRAVAPLAVLLVSAAACAGVAQAGPPPDSGYEFARVTYASDYCTQLRWERPELGDADGDDASSQAAVSRTVAVAPGTGTRPTAIVQDAADTDTDTDTVEGRDERALADAELLLSSRFNQESCEGSEIGAVVEDKTQLPLLVAALQAVHEALAVQPDWIDDYNLPRDWQRCWRRGARLSDVLVDSNDGGIELYLEVQDCTGQAQRVRLQLQPADEEQPQGYRRSGGILAVTAPFVVCGLLE